MVEDGKIIGILDWEHSGFFPKYMEYVTAMEICDGHEDWWRPVLKEILESSGFLRRKFQAQVKNRGGDIFRSAFITALVTIIYQYCRRTLSYTLRPSVTVKDNYAICVYESTVHRVRA